MPYIKTDAMTRLSFSSIIIFLFMLEACTKTVDNSSVDSSNSASIFPMQTGNSWVYQDSIFDAKGKTVLNYTDTAFIADQTIASNGYIFHAFNDSLGWFGANSYIAVDGSNASLFVLDSLNAVSPYLFFTITAPDPGSSEADALYSFATTFNVNGFSCYKNLEQVKDENGNIIYANVYYVSPGIGVVRIEEYSPNPDSKALYLDYSQTLKSYNFK